MRKYKTMILCSISSSFKIGEYQTPCFANEIKVGSVISLPLALNAWRDDGRESLFNSGTYLVDTVGDIEEKLIFEISPYTIKGEKTLEFNTNPCSINKVENNLMNKIKEEISSLRR